MAYCTYQDVETRLGAEQLAALADYDADGDADQAVVEQAMRDAQALMDSYLGVRYRVPVELDDGGCPEALTVRAVNLTVYLLQLGRDSVPDNAYAQHRDDVAWLNQVAAGQVSLGAAEKAPEAPGAPRVKAEARDRLFGRGEPL